MARDDFDLLIGAGSVVCPASKLEGPGSVAVCGDRIVASGLAVQGSAQRTLEFPDALLLPGLIDLHAHPAREGSKYGVDPDIEFLPRGVTTVASQGDAGAANWRVFRETTISGSRIRVRLAINLSARGESRTCGCFEQLNDVDVDACVSAIQQGGELIWAISVNLSRAACGKTDPRELMRRALQAAERTGRPLLFGMRRPADWPIEEQMALLRPGDVVTYCFRSEYILKDGCVHPAVHEARRRGVLFDVGHGMQSFHFAVVETALSDGFAPDTISTDQYARHVGIRPQHDLPRTMSKLIAAGMPQSDVLAAVTSRPARILGLEGEIGTLASGACADLVVLCCNEHAAPLRDVGGVGRPGGCWEAALTVRAGQIV